MNTLRSLIGTADWGELFGLHTSLLEIVLRGTVTYLGLFVLLRVIHRRQSGTIGITDLLMIVLIADAAQNAMAGEYRSITDGLLLVGVLVFWSWFLDWIGHRVPAIQRIVHPPALRFVKDGQIIHRNLRKELFTEEELMSQLRLQGVSDVSEVRDAYLEPDGRVSVVKRKSEPGSPPGRRGA